MIQEEKINEIRRFLLESKMPLFMFDDDIDGLCSYLLLKRLIKRGNFVAIKSTPKLGRSFLNRVVENRPDRIFVLDKPMMEQEFVDDVNVPIVWIDHHEPQKDVLGVKYYNPRIEDDKDNRPTTYWCYRVANQDEWMAMIGIIGDWHMPEFADKFSKEHPDLLQQTKNIGKAVFESNIGLLIKIMAFSLKGKSSDVTKNIKLLEEIESPYEILNQTTKAGKKLHSYFESIKGDYEKILSEAIKNVTKEEVLLYTYPSTKHSFTGNLSNELIYRYPEKIVIVGREKEDSVVLSFRSSGVELPSLIQEALIGLNGYGGGHKLACGGNINKNDFQEFIKRFKALVKKNH